MKPATLILVSAVLFSSAALAQSSRDSDRRSDRYEDTPQFIEPPYGNHNQNYNRNRNHNYNNSHYGNQYGSPPPARPGDANPYANTPGAPNPWATVPGTPPNSQPVHNGYSRPGSASSGSTVKAAPSPGGGLLPEERRYGSGDGGNSRRR